VWQYLAPVHKADGEGRAPVAAVPAPAVKELVRKGHAPLWQYFSPVHFRLLYSVFDEREASYAQGTHQLVLEADAAERIANQAAR
jgi:hypothetical protein